MTHTTTSTLPGIAVIGSGYWGKNLIRNFHHIGALRLICEKDAALLAHFHEQYPDVESCLALSDVLAHKDVEGVVIATPAETHYTLAKEALLAGKHVFVEKPLVLIEEQAQELIAIARERPCILMVG